MEDRPCLQVFSLSHREDAKGAKGRGNESVALPARCGNIEIEAGHRINMVVVMTRMVELSWRSLRLWGDFLSSDRSGRTSAV